LESVANFKKLLLTVICCIAVFLITYFYHLRLSTLIYNLDEYFLWLIGFASWLASYRMIQLNALFIGITFLIFYISSLFLLKTNGDSNSLKTIISTYQLIGISLFLSTNFNFTRPKNILIIILPAFFLQVFYGSYQAYLDNFESLSIKGFLYNSGFYANYIAAFIPLIFAFQFQKIIFPIKRGLFIVLLLFSIVLVVFTLSRSAILGMLIGVCFFIVLHFKDEINAFSKKRLFALALFTILGILTFFNMLYGLKKDSANGRILIYKVSLTIIKENLLFGIGPGRFQAEYNNYQSQYLNSRNIPINVQLLSSDTFEAYNLFIQILSEYGLLGILILIILFVLVIVQFKRESIYSKHKDWFYYGCLGSIITIIIESLFSNPFHVTPLLLHFFILLGVCLSYYKKPFQIKRNSFFLYLILLVGGFSLSYSFQQMWAEKEWQKAATLALFGQYDKALPIYKKAYSVLKKNGRFLYNYGAESAIVSNATLSEQILNEAKKYCSFSNLYVFQGDNYRILKNYNESESNYLHAMHCIPWHIYPKFQLIKLYKQIDDKKKLEALSMNTIKYPIKIHSELYNEILEKIRTNTY
jgi:O-antigen polymerase